MKVIRVLNQKMTVIILLLLFFIPLLSMAETTTYDFSTLSTTENKAYMCDVDIFPFGGTTNYLNSKVELEDYDLVAFSDDASVSADPGGSSTYTDEMMIWVEMEVPEDESNISKIELLMEGTSDATNNFFIFVKKAGENPFLNSSWVQIAGPIEILANEDGIVTGAITYNFSKYIEDGKINWIAGAVRGYNNILSVDYLKMKVTTASATTCVEQSVYDFSNISTNDNQAYLWDVDDFPFNGNTDYLNYRTEVSDYSLIEASDNEVTSINPGGTLTYGDEALMELNMTIYEDPQKISKIRLIFEGYSSADNGFYIYVKKAGANMFVNASWDLVAGPVKLTADLPGVAVGTILNYNPKDYIENGKITWIVGTPQGHRDTLYIDYVRMEVEVSEGAMDVALSSDNQLKGIITNTSDYPMKGVFSVLYDQSETYRQKLGHIFLEVPAQSESQTLEWSDFIIDLNWVDFLIYYYNTMFLGDRALFDSELMLVFEGQLGDEDGVVVTKLVTPSTDMFDE